MFLACEASQGMNRTFEGQKGEYSEDTMSKVLMEKTNYYNMQHRLTLTIFSFHQSYDTNNCS